MSPLMHAASAVALTLTASAVALYSDVGLAQVAPVSATAAPAAGDPTSGASFGPESFQQGVEILDENTPVQPPLPTPSVETAKPAPQRTQIVATPRTQSLRQLVGQLGGSSLTDAEAHCMAVTVYHESKGEALEGQLAVAEVLENRAASGRFPRSICGVVRQAGQFSFVRGGVLPGVNRNSAQWRQAVAITQIARNNLWRSPAAGALFFHAARVSPGWRLARIAQIDNHIFYR